MPRTPITLKTTDGSTRTGEADVRSHSTSARTAKAAGLMVAGFVGGAACIIIPVLHLVTTWGLPLLGIVLGLRAYRTQATIEEGTATCPACDTPFELEPVNVAAEPPTVVCPACSQHLEIVLPTPETSVS